MIVINAFTLTLPQFTLPLGRCNEHSLVKHLRNTTTTYHLSSMDHKLFPNVGSRRFSCILYGLGKEPKNPQITYLP